MVLNFIFACSVIFLWLLTMNLFSGCNNNNTALFNPKWDKATISYSLIK